MNFTLLSTTTPLNHYAAFVDGTFSFDDDVNYITTFTIEYINEESQQFYIKCLVCECTCYLYCSSQDIVQADNWSQQKAIFEFVYENGKTFIVSSEKYYLCVRPFFHNYLALRTMDKDCIKCEVIMAS